MRNTLLSLALLFIASTAWAQPVPLPSSTPPTGDTDKCYAICYYPQQFETVAENVSTYDGGSALRVVAPAYETYTESVMVRPASYRLVEVPAEYTTVEERVETAAAYTEYSVQAAVWEDGTERIMIEEGGNSYRLGNPSFETVTNANLYYGTPSSDGSITSSDYGNILDPNGAQGLNGNGAPFNPNNPNGLLNDPNSPFVASPTTYASNSGAGALFDPQNPESPFSAAFIDANGIEAAQTRAGELLQMAGVGSITPYLTSEARVEVDRVRREYDTETQTIEVQPAYFTYEPRPSTCDDGSENCITWCAVEVPAQSTVVNRRVPRACAEGYTAVTGGGSDGRATDDDTEYCVRISYQAAEYGARQVMIGGPTIERRSSEPRYREVPVRRLVSPAQVIETPVPAQYETVTKRVVAREAYTRVELVPAEYDDVTRRVRRGLRGADFMVDGGVLMAPTTAGGNLPLTVNPGAGGQVPGSVMPYTVGNGPDRAGNITPSGYAPVSPTINQGAAGMPDLFYTAGCPEDYRYDATDGLCKATDNLASQATTVERRVATTQGNFSEWTEVLCPQNATPVSIRSLQRALNSAGYDAGVADGIMGARTKAALAKYQQDNNLPIGGMNIPTLRALGLR